MRKGFAMKDFFELTRSTLLGVAVDEMDFDTIADTLKESVRHEKKEEIKRHIHNHWDNLFQCVRLVSEDDNMYYLNRNQVFEMAEWRHQVEIGPDKGEFLRRWASLLNGEILQGRLKHFADFEKSTLERGSILASLKRHKYEIRTTVIRKYFQGAKDELGRFNSKAVEVLDQFVDWSFDRSIERPWLSPIFIGVIILLLLFTVTIVGLPTFSFGLLLPLWNSIVTICRLCTFAFLAREAAEFSGIIPKP